MQRSLILTGLCAVFCVSMGYAQLTENDTLRWAYRSSVSGSWTTGNVERLLVNTNAELSHMAKSTGWKSSNAYLFGTIYKVKTENDIFSRNFFYLNPRKRLYPYLMAWLQNSTRQKINARYQLGIGASYTIVNCPATHLKASLTFSYEKTHYDGSNFYILPENLTGCSITSMRGTVRLIGQQQLLAKKLRLVYETWYQPSLQDEANWRYYLTASLELPLSGHFALRSSLVYTHDNMVLTDIKRDDKTLTFGVSISNL